MSTLTTINAGDTITSSRTVLNANMAALNTDKIETSTLDTDTTLAANSDSKIATQKAVKAYADSLAGLTTKTSGVGSTPVSSSTQTITHSFGRIPSCIRITGMGGNDASASSNQPGVSHGTWNSSGNCCVYVMANDTGDSASSTAYAIHIGYSLSGAIRWEGTAVIQNVTSTTFDLVWTITAPDGHTLYYLWEAN